MLWRTIQKNNFIDLEKLCKFLELSQDKRDLLLQKPPFVLNLPTRLAHKIKKNCLDDPLLRQFVPLKEESQKNGLLDPVEEVFFQKTPNLLHKYEGRALLITTGACAMHCRYCFRKNYPYESSNFTQELELIKADKSLEEIILSGGDPLSLSDQKLFDLLEALEAIPHLKRIRFHTRFLIGIPERIHEGFLKKLKTLKKQVIFVIHVNHVQELDEDIFNACHDLLGCKIPVLSQTVLLKGVNDNFPSLVELFKTLVNHGIMPYYLHQLDPIEGGAHFEVPLNDGLKLYHKLQDHLPGYAVPRYVQEIPHKKSKIPL